MRKLAGLGFALYFALSVSSTALSQTNDSGASYAYDFEGTVGPEWSIQKIDATPAGGRRFLGQFGNDTVMLTLDSLPPHSAITVRFDLYVIRSWDGSGYSDIWELFADNTLLLQTTFDNQDFYDDHNQAYPGTYPEHTHSPRTGATENNTLGYFFKDARFGDIAMDSVYEMIHAFPHSSDRLVLSFSARGLQHIRDESWGLDNVEVILEPGTNEDSPIHYVFDPSSQHMSLVFNKNVTPNEPRGRLECQGFVEVESRGIEISGDIPFTAVGWGGMCDSYGMNTPPTKALSVESALMFEFTIPETNSYHIQVEFVLDGAAHADAGANLDELYELWLEKTLYIVPDWFWRVYSLTTIDAGSLASAQNHVFAEIQAYTGTGQVSQNIGDVVASGTRFPFNPNSMMTPLHETITLDVPMLLNAGDSIVIKAGLRATLQAWGNAGVVVEFNEARVSKIQIRASG